MELICGDCLKAMENIPENSVDLIFTDLPYGTTKNHWDCAILLNDYVEINGNFLSETEYFLYAYKERIEFRQAQKNFNCNKKLGLWTQYNRILKDNGCIALWAQQPFANTLIESNPSEFRYEWVIEKTQAKGFLNANRTPLRAHELILIFYKHLPKYNPQKTVERSKIMNLDITYCANYYCPFKNCERHLCQLSGIKDEYISIADFDGICREYIACLANKTAE